MNRIKILSLFFLVTSLVILTIILFFKKNNLEKDLQPYKTHENMYKQYFNQITDELTANGLNKDGGVDCIKKTAKENPLLLGQMCDSLCSQENDFYLLSKNACNNMKKTEDYISKCSGINELAQQLSNDNVQEPGDIIESDGAWVSRR